MRGLTLAAVALLATACAPTQGEVTNISHKPGWTETTRRCDPNKTGCTPEVVEYSETYRLRLDDGTEAGWRTVTEREYHQCPIGAHYPDCTQGEGRGNAHDRR